MAGLLIVDHELLVEPVCTDELLVSPRIDPSALLPEHEMDVRFPTHKRSNDRKDPFLYSLP